MNLKKWILTLMAAFMLLGVATACNNDTDDTNTEETENGTDEGTEEGNEEGNEEEGQ